MTVRDDDRSAAATAPQTRRRLLQSLLAPRRRDRRPPLRPPWALAEAAFVDACSRCRRCIDACPAGVLRAGDGGFPEVDFAAGACTFCRRCVESCAAAAFVDPAEAPPWSAVAAVGARCLTRQGVVCQSCRDVCERRAVGFTALPGQAPRPYIEPDRCSGCGACVAVCPTAAIEVAAGAAPAPRGAGV